MDQNLSDSQWDDFDVYHTFQGTVADIKKITTLLRVAYPDKQIEIELSFQSFNMLQTFQRKLQLEHQILYPQKKIIDKADSEYIWNNIHDKSIRKRLQGLDKLKFYFVTFRNSIELTIFYSHYEKRLAAMQTEYNYFIIPYKKRFGVYLRNYHDQKISSFFITELIDMKNKLLIYIDTDEEVCEKIRYSKFAVQKLEKLNIKAMALKTYGSSVFYSDQYKYGSQIKKEVRRTLAYHISVIKLPDIYVDSYILQEITKLIYFEIKPALNQIQRSFEMPVEIDIEKSAFVITDYHEVFTDGVNLVKQNLEKIRILQIECKNLEDLRKLMQKPQYASFVKFNYRYRKCFLLFTDDTTNKHSKLVDKFFLEMGTFFREKYRIIVHCVQWYLDQAKLMKQMQRGYRLAEYYKLESLSYSRFMTTRQFNKILIEPKQLSVYSAAFRELQMRMFLQDFITNKDVKSHQWKYSISSDPNLDQSSLTFQTQNSFFSHKGSISTKSQVSEDQKSVKTLLQQSFSKKAKNIIQNDQHKKGKQSSSIQLTIPLEYPLQEKCDQNLPSKRGKRCRLMENTIETKWNRKVRLWKIIIHSTISVPQIKSYEKIELITSRMFDFSNENYSLKKYTKVDTKEVRQFTIGQIGYMSFINREKNVFVPLYEVEFID